VTAASHPHGIASTEGHGRRAGGARLYLSPGHVATRWRCGLWQGGRDFYCRRQHVGSLVLQYRT